MDLENMAYRLECHFYEELLCSLASVAEASTHYKVVDIGFLGAIMGL